MALDEYCGRKGCNNLASTAVALADWGTGLPPGIRQTGYAVLCKEHKDFPVGTYEFRGEIILKPSGFELRAPNGD